MPEPKQKTHQRNFAKKGWRATKPQNRLKR
jgi:hypothetical protein